MMSTARHIQNFENFENCNVTKWKREGIESMIGDIQQELGLNVIPSDTDSLMEDSDDQGFKTTLGLDKIDLYINDDTSLVNNKNEVKASISQDLKTRFHTKIPRPRFNKKKSS
mmetsp:Transcript_39189/g.44867  ORF Transcript_39189/g.44867 Transcript_39189/m.44867 type:complete len:113 (-) Transcript_39189:72-410(-)